MDRVTMIDQTGRLYFMEPPHPVVYELFDRDLNAPDRSINRVSNSEWCFWAVTADFEVVLYVYQRNFPLQAVVSTYENQRRSSILSNSGSNDRNWSKSTSRFEFSSEDGLVELAKDTFQLPSAHWRWNTGWTIADDDYSSKNDDGWAYSTSFSGNFRQKPFFYAFVRRRKWIRKRTFCSYNTFIQVDSPVGLEFVNDIAVGGWMMPGQNIKGFLCVWIVTNNGRLFFREKVSFDNPEGSNWLEIKLPSGLTALATTCSQNGSFFLLTCEAKVLLRTGITPGQPYGDAWTLVQPYPDAVFTQITSNLNLVYTLDINSNVYLLSIDEDSSEWIRVLKDLSNISLSISNKIWALSKDRCRIYIGSKIHSIHDKAKFSWRTVNSPVALDRLDAAIAFDTLDDLANLSLTSIVNTNSSFRTSSF